MPISSGSVGRALNCGTITASTTGSRYSATSQWPARFQWPSADASALCTTVCRAPSRRVDTVLSDAFCACDRSPSETELREYYGSANTSTERQSETVLAHSMLATIPDKSITLSDVNATMFDRYLPFSCPLNTFVTDAVRFAPFHHHWLALCFWSALQLYVSLLTGTLLWYSAWLSDVATDPVSLLPARDLRTFLPSLRTLCLTSVWCSLFHWIIIKRHNHFCW